MRLLLFALRCSVFLLVVCVALVPLAHAQAPTGTATLAVDISTFPALTAYLALANADGARVPDLTAAAFTLTEDNQSIAQFVVDEAEVGVQTVFAIDTSAAFKARDANGVTRLEYIQQALTDFAQNTLRDNVDDVTVLTPENLLIGHSATGREVAAAVNAYATEFSGAADPFSIYNAALDYAASLTPRPGMRQTLVLLSNGLPGAEAQARAADLAARAVAARVQIHTVFIGPLGAGNTANAQFLRALAQQTGGAFIVYESLPDFAPLFQRLADQRTQYRFTYRSAIANTAQHTLIIKVTLPDGATLAATASFPLRVEPPTVLLNAPAEMQLTAPGALSVPFSVDFPDNHPREVRAAQLLVNGEALAAQTAPPFDAAQWPVTASGAYTLAVRITDELGLTALSEPVSITLTLTTASTPLPTLEAAVVTAPSGLDWKMGLAVGTLLLAALAGSGLWLWRRRGRRAPAPPIASVMVTQPMPQPLPKTAPLIKPRTRITLPRRPARVARPVASIERPMGRAYLEVVDPGGGGAPFPDIELPDQPLKLGRDGALADIVFHDRSVSRLHARIESTPEGVFHIFDEGSTSGTWVNFTAIPSDAGWELRPGDLVNLGRVQLRFKPREIQSSVETPPPP